MSKISKFSENWYVWFFPIIALALSLWLAKEFISKRGPEIKISFSDASGIEPEKTEIRYRGVTIGTVKEVLIAEDREKVEVMAVLRRENEAFAVKGTRFWVVKPKVDLQGISGLETLVEGSYIAVQPAEKSTEPQYEFRGQVGSQSVDESDAMTSYFLETDQLGSVSAGDHVTYRGMKVGSIGKVSLSKSAQHIIVQIDIEPRHTRLIHNNTVFWRKLAVDASLGLFKSELKVGALDSLLHGGVEFATPTQADGVAKPQSRFVLSPGPPKDWERWNPNLEL